MSHVWPQLSTRHLNLIPGGITWLSEDELKDLASVIIIRKEDDKEFTPVLGDRGTPTMAWVK